METKKFEELIGDVRQQLTDNEIDFVLVATNMEPNQPIDGILAIASKHDINIHADFLFTAAANGEVSAQHFIERIINNVLSSVKGYFQKKKPASNNNPNFN